MNSEGQSCVSESQSEEEMDMRRGPWTTEEDLLLVNYISKHGEGRWNSLSQCAGIAQFQVLLCFSVLVLLHKS